MKFKKLVLYFEDLEKVSSGNAIRAILSDLFKKTDKNEIDKVVYLTLGKIVPDYSSLNFGMADKTIIKAISLASNKELSIVEEYYKKSGDVGETAYKFIDNKGYLSVESVFFELTKIAKLSGEGSYGVKVRTFSGLLSKCSNLEAKYLSRIVLGTLRLGASLMSVFDALSIAFTGSKDSKVYIENAYNYCADSGYVAKVIATKGIKALSKIEVKLLRPVKMMLAQRVSDISELKKHVPGKFAVEEKYDGERMQIHFDGKEVVIFSRRLDDITLQFPDVVRAVKKHIKAKNFIIEGEAVACKNNVLKPFQILMRRRRKYDVEKYMSMIPVCLFVFDVLYLNGKSLIKKPFSDRREKLSKIVSESEHVKRAVGIVTEENEELLSFFKKSVARHCEGIMVKSLSDDSYYVPGLRGWKWIKWKKEYVKGLIDTFDLVIVGAFFGKGRRKGLYGAFLCAINDPKKSVYLTVTKIGTGFSDESLKSLFKKLKQYESRVKPKDVSSKIKPDVWFRPELVIEVLSPEATISPLHTAGIALRFPRFIRIRDDKSSLQTTLLNDIKKILKK